MSRRAAGTLVLGVWILVLGWHAREEHFPDEAERLARGAAVLAPGDTYYSVLTRGRVVGWARSSVDTLPGDAGFRLESRMEISGATRAPGDGAILPSLSLRSESRLDPLLRLRSFSGRTSGPMGELAVRGRVVGDSVLEAIVQGRGRADTLRIAMGGPVVPPSALPLRLAASRRLTVGRSVRVDVLDPLRMEPTGVLVEVEGREVRSFVDSAARRGSAGPWVAARRDTVTAWRIRHSLGPVSLASWIGEDGRLVEARVGDALALRRTAFELAFYPDSAGGGPGSTEADPPSREDPP